MEWKPTDVTILFVYCRISTCFGPTGPIFRRVRTAVHITIGSVSVPLCSRALCVVACLGDYFLFSTYGMKTNWCHYFIRILPDLYMFRSHRPIFRRVRTAAHTTIGSVSVRLCSRALCVVACLGDYFLFSTYGMKTNWCHYFIRILPDLYMFRAHRSIFRSVRTTVHTTIGSVSVPLCSRALYVVVCLGDYSLYSL